MSARSLEMEGRVAQEKGKEGKGESGTRAPRQKSLVRSDLVLWLYK